MNKLRRKALGDIIDRLEEIMADLDALKEEEEDYRDNMPENLQGSERYERAEEAIYNMDDAMNNLEETISSIESAIE